MSVVWHHPHRARACGQWPGPPASASASAPALGLALAVWPVLWAGALGAAPPAEPAAFILNFHPLEPHFLDVDDNGRLDLADADRLSLVQGRLGKLIIDLGLAESLPELGPDPPDRPARDAGRWQLLWRLARGLGPPAALTPALAYDTRRLALFGERVLRLRCAIAASERQTCRAGVGDPGAEDEAWAPALGPGSSERIAHLDLGPLAALGYRPLWVTDLDDTAWSSGVSEVFVEHMIATRRVRPAGGARVAAYLRQALDSCTTESRLRAMARLLVPGSEPQRLPLPALRRRLAELIDAGPAQRNLERVQALIGDRSYRGLPTGEDLHWLSGYDYFMVGAAITAGYTPAELDAIAEELFERGSRGVPPFEGHLFPAQQARYQALIAAGVEGWAISGGLEFLARAGARRVGIPPERVLAAALLMGPDGRSVGVPSDNPFHYKDDALLRIVERSSGLPVACYGDSVLSDTPMATLVAFARRLAGGQGPYLLRPELKATSGGGDATRRWLERFNAAFGVEIEAPGRPATFRELARPAAPAAGR